MFNLGLLPRSINIRVKQQPSIIRFGKKFRRTLSTFLGIMSRVAKGSDLGISLIHDDDDDVSHL